MNNDKKVRDRVRLSPLEKEILWTLREVGEENLTALLNMIEPLVSPSPVENFLLSCEQALADLCRLKYIELRIEQESLAGHRQEPVNGKLDLNLAVQRGSDRLWRQAESWNDEGRIVVVQLVDHSAG